MKAPYLEILCELFQLFEAIALERENVSEIANKIQASIKVSADNVVQIIDEQNRATDFYLEKRNMLEYVVNIVEVISHL